MTNTDDEFGRGLRHAADLIRPFDQDQTGWHVKFDRETVREMVRVIETTADHRAARLTSEEQVDVLEIARSILTSATGVSEAKHRPGTVVLATVRGERQRVMFVGWPSEATGWVSETGQFGPLADDDTLTDVRPLDAAKEVQEANFRLERMAESLAEFKAAVITEQRYAKNAEAVSERRSRELKEYAVRAWEAEAKVARVEAVIETIEAGARGNVALRLRAALTEPEPTIQEGCAEPANPGA